MNRSFPPGPYGFVTLAFSLPRSCPSRKRPESKWRKKARLSRTRLPWNPRLSASKLSSEPGSCSDSGTRSRRSRKLRRPGKTAALTEQKAFWLNGDKFYIDFFVALLFPAERCCVGAYGISTLWATQWLVDKMAIVCSVVRGAALLT